MAYCTTTIVIPTFNERENVGRLAASILGKAPQARLLVVDDASPDGTGEVVESLAARHPGRVFLLRRNQKDGLGRAYVHGFRHALACWPDCPFFVQMDADFSHDPAHLAALIDAAAEADVAVGSRYVRGISIVNWPLQRLVISQLATLYARTVTGLPATDCTSGFKCYRREVLERIDLETLRANGYAFQVESLYRAWRLGFRIVDVPIVFYDRTVGESKLDISIAWEALVLTTRLGMGRMLMRKAALNSAHEEQAH